MCKVSIVTVCMNDALGLEKTIESVRRQTFKDYQFIITDGGSTDGTIEIIKKNEDIIDDWISERDKGIYNAMNKSLKRCKGEYVIFMNSGDCFYDSNVITNVFSSNPTSDVVYGDVRFDRLLKANRDIKTLQDFFCKSPFCHQGVFTKLKSAQNIGFDEKYRIVADWIMFVRIFILGGKFEYVPFVVAQCSSGGVSPDLFKNNKERLRFLEKIYTKRITDDYLELQNIKNGVLFKEYLMLEKSRKIKYYLHSLFKLFNKNI